MVELINGAEYPGLGMKLGAQAQTSGSLQTNSVTVGRWFFSQNGDVEEILAVRSRKLIRRLADKGRMLTRHHAHTRKIDGFETRAGINLGNTDPSSVRVTTGQGNNLVIHFENAARVTEQDFTFFR